MMRMRHVVWFCMLIVLIFISSAPAYAQDNTCPAVVRAALESVDDRCDSTGRNEACYGNVTLTAQPRNGFDNFTFEAPGDRVDVEALESIRLTSMNTSTDEWGVALMEVQANLPDESTENVSFLLFGDVQVENAVTIEAEREAATSQVEVETAPIPITLQVTANSGANVRGAPSTNAGIVVGLSAGESVTADGRNGAGDWVRIQLDSGGIGWVFASIVQIDGDVQTLPVVDDSDNSPATPQTIPAQPIQYGDSINDVIAAGEASNVYTFNALANDIISVNMTPASEDMDALLYLMDGAGNRLVSGFPLISEYIVPAAGQYRIVATTYGESAADYEREFVLNLEFIRLLYRQMQAFFIQTGADDAPCQTAPDSGILIQTPDGVGEISLLINEVVIELGSTVYVQAQPNDYMTISVVEGHALVSAFNVAVYVPAGARVRVPMDGRPAASGPPEQLEAYETADVQALPIDGLRQDIAIAEPAPIELLESDTPLPGQWQIHWETSCDPVAYADYITTLAYENDGESISFSRAILNRVGEGQYEGVDNTDYIYAPDSDESQVISRRVWRWSIAVISPTIIRGEESRDYYDYQGNWGPGIEEQCDEVTNTFTATLISLESE